MHNGPIGIFDSGVGGTSVWSEINSLLPSENTIYLGDSKNAPYGGKPQEEILNLSIKNTEFLLAQGCKIVVVACNTATTNAISYLREHYTIPFIGIEPAIKPAALNSKSRIVGVLATKGTLASELFSKTAKDYAAGIRIVEQEGTGLVSLIESGAIHSEKTTDLLHSYLKPMLDAGMDHLVLGCTHYPYLIPLLKKLLPAEVKIIDCGEAVARQTARVLAKRQLLNPSVQKGNHSFYTNGNLETLKYFLAETKEEIQIQFLDF